MDQDFFPSSRELGDPEFLNGSFPRSQRASPFMEVMPAPQALSSLDAPRMPLSYSSPTLMSNNFSVDERIPINPDFPPATARDFEGPLPGGVTLLSDLPKPIASHPQGFRTKSYLGLNCIDVANHLSECPVCSKLHKSNSNIYMAIIVVLVIIIIFLGRKFFD